MTEPIQCGCEKPGIKVEGFIVPCLLFVLGESPAHGYEIIDKLGTLPFVDFVPDPGVIYRHLRTLEIEGKLKSELQPGSGGPARKVYSMTPEGEQYLHQWAEKIRRRLSSLRLFLESYDQNFVKHSEKELFQ